MSNMATRGPKPKPAHLRVVDGTHRPTRHGDSGKIRAEIEQTVAAFGKLTMPRGLKGEAARAWKRYIAPAGWLDGSREAAAIAFCHLWQEFILNPNGFPSSKHGQMRAYMSELGLTDERNRGNADDGKAKDPYFD